MVHNEVMFGRMIRLDIQFTIKLSCHSFVTLKVDVHLSFVCKMFFLNWFVKMLF